MSEAIWRAIAMMPAPKFPQYKTLIFEALKKRGTT